MAHLNIEHYKRLLATETDENKCKMLRKLLAEEEAKLASVQPKTPGGGIRFSGPHN